jgi:uncharacterized repeat protein (TIGR03803 family)
MAFGFMHGDGWFDILPSEQLPRAVKTSSPGSHDHASEWQDTFTVEVNMGSGGRSESKGMRERLAKAAIIVAMLLLTMVVVEQGGQAQNINIQVLYQFAGTPDGGQVYGPLAGDRAGNLYGTTSQGGFYGKGSVWKLDASGKETVLYSFNGPDSSIGYTGLVRDAENNFYGMTLGGGTYDKGTVFKIDAVGNFQSLYSFSGPDGAYPYAPNVIRDAAGNIYGTTANGGVYDLGTVFKLDTAGQETVLHSFSGSDGSTPTAGLIQDAKGNLYGATIGGGAFGGGTVFKMDSSGNETILHSFAGSDGAAPTTSLIADAKGNFYGTTEGGGAFGNGTVYKLDPSGALTVLHSYDAAADGVEPFGRLVHDNYGNLWGTTETQGPLGLGAIYRLDTKGNFTVYGFPDPSIGANPFAGMIRDSQGNLYGGTTGGGSGVGWGTVYKIIP